MPDKLTDNEIVKALECCNEWEKPEDCTNCPAKGKGECCVLTLKIDALDLINRQKAENKELLEISKKLNEELEITREYIHDNGLEWDLLSYSKRNGR